MDIKLDFNYLIKRLALKIKIEKNILLENYYLDERDIKVIYQLSSLIKTNLNTINGLNDYYYKSVSFLTYYGLIVAEPSELEIYTTDIEEFIYSIHKYKINIIYLENMCKECYQNILLNQIMNFLFEQIPNYLPYYIPKTKEYFDNYKLSIKDNNFSKNNKVNKSNCSIL